MKIRVYYEDTDCGNVVYYANYLRYMERSRTEYLRERGIDLCAYQAKGLLFAVVEANVKYRRPAKYNDLLEVESRVTETTSVSITFETLIDNQSRERLVEGLVKLVCISAEGKARRIPAEILAVVSTSQEGAAAPPKSPEGGLEFFGSSCGGTVGEGA
jgi:acyl-CoA thioester hydrolase